VVTTVAAPRELVLERYVDFWASWGRGDLRLHLQVQRWAMDEFALPGRLVAEIVEDLYRRDRFMRGDLVIGGARVGPGTLTVPMLNVVDPHDGAIPASSIVTFHRAAASPRKELLEYHADHGSPCGTSACSSGTARARSCGRGSSTGSTGSTEARRSEAISRRRRSAGRTGCHPTRRVPRNRRCGRPARC
jgi:hypothetical protein